jgi:O-antigen ligase
MNHIRYSLLVTLSILGGIVMIERKFYLRWPWERIVIGMLTIGLLIFQHILSVRTGLLLSYIGIMILLGVYGFKSKYRLAISAICIGIFLLPVVAYKTIPAFQKKIGYTLYDLDKFRSGEGSGYADSERFRSWETGLAIASKSPFFGTGVGDIKDETISYYKSEYNTDHYWTPHSQYISVFAGSGLLGLSIFMFGLLFPLFYQGHYQDELFLVVYITFLLSMLVEVTLSSYIGSSIFLLFVMFGLSQAVMKEPNIEDT